MYFEAILWHFMHPVLVELDPWLLEIEEEEDSCT